MYGPKSGEDNWSTSTDVLLLHTIASAVIHMAAMRDLDSFTMPYPADAQRALDRMVLTCLQRGVTDLPRGVPDLLAWCRTRPLEDWPLQLPEDAFGPDDVFIDLHANVPTQLCDEWAVGARDEAAREFDKQVIRAAMQLCHQASSPESYTAFRRLLVERPVLSSTARFDIRTDLYLDPVLELLDRCYEEAPVSFASHQTFSACERCRTLLLPLPDGGWWCEREACRRRGRASPGAVYSSIDGPVYQLVRPLRQFVTGPGIAEVELEAELGRLHHNAARLEVVMWPGFDAYDLHITFPDGHVWAVDVKDWKHPGLLGRTGRRVPPQPPYNEACWVVPHDQAAAHGKYMATFYRNLPASANGLVLLTSRELVDLARKRLHGDMTVQLRSSRPRSGDEGA